MNEPGDASGGSNRRFAGIGRRTCEVLGERGFRLATIYLRLPVEMPDSDTLGFAGDVTNEDVVAQFSDKVLRR